MIEKNYTYYNVTLSVLANVVKSGICMFLFKIPASGKNLFIPGFV